MGYRMLLGREAMGGKMLVDPFKSFCFGNITTSQLNKYYYSDNKPKSGLKIALLASNKQLYSNQRIIQAGEEYGHEMRFFKYQAMLYET